MLTKEGNVKISLNLSRVLKEKLEKQAVAEGKTQTDILVKLLEAYVHGESVPPQNELLVESCKKIDLLLNFEPMNKEALQREVGRLIWLVKN